MGLGSASQERSMFLSVAGGFIWNRKAEKDDADYKEQTFDRADGTQGVRTGARHDHLTGTIVGVEFKTHEKYGQNLNVTVESEGERYVLSISTNNQYSQSFMKALLLIDLQKSLFIKPFDFTGQDGKRAQGISFRQDGEKIDLKKVVTPASFQKDKSFWKQASKKDIKRFFEDLTDWFVAEIQESICSKFKPLEPIVSKDKLQPTTSEKPVEESQVEQSENISIKKVESAEVRPSAIKMKRFLKEYIHENYSEQEQLPRLTKEQVEVWYDLAKSEEELPFESDNSVGDDELKGELSALLGK
tara:strand:+ start:6968 stop:7870 length:903 start_codon:yes stop_codon:yes gene_type:complete